MSSPSRRHLGRSWLRPLSLSPSSLTNLAVTCIPLVVASHEASHSHYLLPLTQIEGSDKNREKVKDVVTEKDLEHLLHLLEAGNANIEWQSMMDKSTPNMSYQAWRHELETCPVVHRIRTFFEDASPEIVRDFFWDDEFRPKWDPMLAYFKTLEEDPKTGTTIVHWIKSDLKYIIGRRIWESGKKYYAVTKGVPYSDVPKQVKLRRIELYFSSWIIKAVESRKGDGQMSACEVSLVHYEDMGIPIDVAKLGVRHGMRKWRESPQKLTLDFELK